MIGRFLLLISLLMGINICYALPEIDQPKLEMKVAPRVRLTTNWLIIMDTSASMKGVFKQAFAAYREAISYPTDELNFALITFNNRGMEQFKDWAPASEQEFEKANNLIERENKRGVLSYGAVALTRALQQNKDKLTIILITDGGFTEACEGRGFGSMRNLIRQNQQWRVNQGLGEAIICCLGIENLYYTAGGKPTDANCQAFLRQIGTTYNGGYFLAKQMMPRPTRRRVG